MNKDLLEQRVREMSPWFYDFDLGQGVATCSKLPDEVKPIHETRKAMLRSAMRGYFGDRLNRISALDIGCHEGYFSFMLADEGAGEVVGVDVRSTNIDKARFVCDACGYRNVRFEVADCETLPDTIGRPFDLCLCVGLLYHLENPILCLRNAAALTREMLLIETQVIEPVAGETEWGRREATRPYRGAFALVDESAEHGQGSLEAGATALSLCPSLAALLHVLETVGFARTEVIPPPDDAYEQHQRGKRVVVAACKPGAADG